MQGTSCFPFLKLSSLHYLRIRAAMFRNGAYEHTATDQYFPQRITERLDSLQTFPARLTFYSIQTALKPPLSRPGKCRLKFKQLF